jgi:hypothetical protein
MFVCCECCVLSGTGLCDELITRPEESYQLWCVVVCNLENLKNEEAMTRAGSQRHSKKKSLLHVSTIPLLQWEHVVQFVKFDLAFTFTGIIVYFQQISTANKIHRLY